MELGPLEAIRIIFGLLLIFFLPGYLLVKALFPGKNELDREYNLIYEIGLGMGLSIVIAILDGFLLGSLHQLIGYREDGKGYFATPYIVASLLLICLLLFVAAWYRGAFPWMGRIHPGLGRVPASERPQARKRRMDDLIIRIWELSREREKRRKEVRDCERKARAHGTEMRVHYRKRLEEARQRLAEVDKQIKELEDKRAEELAGVDEEELRRKDEKAKRRQAGGWLSKKATPEGTTLPVAGAPTSKEAESEKPSAQDTAPAEARLPSTSKEVAPPPEMKSGGAEEE